MPAREPRLDLQPARSALKRAPGSASPNLKPARDQTNSRSTGIQNTGQFSPKPPALRNGSVPSPVLSQHAIVKPQQVAIVPSPTAVRFGGGAEPSG